MLPVYVSAFRVKQIAKEEKRERKNKRKKMIDRMLKPSHLLTSLPFLTLLLPRLTSSTILPRTVLPACIYDVHEEMTLLLITLVTAASVCT